METHTNNDREVKEWTHYARAHQRMLREMYAHFGMPCFSGDDNWIWYRESGQLLVAITYQERNYSKGGIVIREKL